MNRKCLRLATFSLAIVCGITSLQAQSPSPISLLRPVPQSDRVAANADFGPQTQLTGHIPAWVSSGTPVASPAVSLNADMRVTIVLQRDPAVQAAFTQFLADQQTPGNPLYHQWLTPQQVGTLFGPTTDDLNTVSNWLTAQGLSVINVEPSGVLINVHGTTAAVGNAFRTSFAYYPINGEAHISAVNEPSVPSAIAPVINSIFGLTDVPLNPTYYRTGPIKPASASGTGSGAGAGLTPQLTYTVGSSYYVTPGDFAIIYDVNSVYNGGNKGAAANGRVAVIGRSRVAATDISEFAANTGIGSSYILNTVIPTGGTDPGAVCTVSNYQTCTTGGDQGEQTLDVDRVIGNAPGATVDLVVSVDSNAIFTDVEYNVGTLKDPIMTISYGACEVSAGSANDNAFDAAYSAGAAVGITTYVSSGDQGVNGCAKSFAANTFTYTASINYLCASTYATCVGGTEFNDASSYATYWNSTNAAGFISAKSYIPEGAWNEPGSSSPYQTAGTGGGPSIYIAKPSYQTALTPADSHRDTPDVAYPAAQHDAYYACLDYALGNASENCTAAGNGYFFGFSGTSAAAPAMAGVTALLNTRLGSSQGNINPLLYTLAAANSTNNVFHSINNTTAGISTCSLTVPSMCNNSTPGSSALSTTATGGQQGYAIAASGYAYSEAIGLGSIDVANLLTAASAKVSTTLAVTATSSTIAAGGSDTFTATLTRTSTTPGAATGTVQFYNGGVAFGSAITISNNVAVSAATPFSAAGTDNITAVYSGDTNYATSTSSAYVLTVTSAPSISVTPTAASLSLVSGVTSGNTDVIAFASLNTFAGTVNYTCSVATGSGTAAGSCALSPTSATLTSGSSANSTLTVTTTPGTSGVLNVTVTGTSGSVVVSSVVAVTLTASSYTLAALPTSISLAGNATTGNTTSVTITSVNNFSGTVTVSCVSSVTSIAACTGGSAAVTPSTPGHVTVTVTPIIHTSGTATLNISGTGTTVGATIAATASTTAALTVTTVNSTTTVAASPTTVVAGSPTTLTATVTVVSANGTPTGTVTFYSGSTQIGTGTLSGTGITGTATYTYTPPAGSASATAVAITASYAGDSGYAASTSAAANLTVSGATAAVTSGSNLSFTSGATSGNTITITFTSVGGYAGPVTASCTITATSGSPASPATCAASAPANVTAGGTTTTTITITSITAHAKMSGPQQAGLTGWGLRGGVVLALLLCLVPFRRRRFIRPLAVVLMLAGALTAISGCSSGGGGSTPAKQSSAGTYTLSVTGTSGTASITTTTTITIN